MSDVIAIRKKKTNKGIAAAAKVRRREEAEARNAAYQKLTIEEKQNRNSIKVIGKLYKTAK